MGTIRRVRPAVCLIVVLLAGRASAQPLPDGWATTDIGAVGATGAASGAGAAFTVSGAGADVWGTADAFRFVYRPLTGDGSIVAQVTSVEYAASWTKAGVMIRETLSPASKHVFMLVSAGKGVALQRRTATGGSSSHTAGPAASAPYFVKLTRAGNVITGAASADGQTWSTVGSITVSMASAVYVGLAVSSHVDGRLATATMDGVAVAPDTPVGTATRTLVFFRHGEKPAGGYGQITCQGLRRALALPDVLLPRYGTPDALFAPNPRPQIPDAAGSFDYVRPLATIEPTAIRLGQPVNAAYGYDDIAAVQAALLGPAYAAATVFIAWEHLKLRELVQNIMDSYGAGVAVPAWPGSDYDSLYVVRITSANGTTSASFQHEAEGLNGLPATCP